MPKSTKAAPRKTNAASVTSAERRRTTQQLRALAHPLRLRLLEAFALGRRTTMQVAAQLGEPPTRLYHHVGALERAGILKLVATRQVRGTTEKYYELASRQIGAIRGEHITDRSRAALAALASAVFDEARGELLAAMGRPELLNPQTAPIALRMLIRLPASQVPGARKRILAALKAIRGDVKRRGERRGERGEAVQWALTLGFAPTVTGNKR